MNAGSITTGTFQLRTSANALVPATVSYDGASRTATLNPTAPLVTGASYTATVAGGTGGVEDAAGNALAADHAWGFTTGQSSCPCNLFGSATPGTAAVSSPSAVELGVKFSADADGWITGLRFYKGATNTGTHVGSLWSTAGQLLARATFTGESASGWQNVSFGTPVAVTAGTTYVASYYAPNGHYAVDLGFFTNAFDNQPLHAPATGASGGNGVYKYGASPSFPTDTYQASNYWVDVVFTTSAPADTTPPQVSSVSPAAGSSSAPVGTNVTATFNEAMSAASITGATVFLRNAAGATVPAALAYDAATRTATIDPTDPLTGGASYTGVVKGGTGGVKDAAGNALASDFTWTFSVQAQGCPCSIFSGAGTPSVPSSVDTASVELGVRFRADVAGTITGVRFYKGASNTGTHVGSLWTNTGTLLARATFSGEAASGWQTVTFATPVAVTAGTTYVASYFAPNGRYSVNTGFFGSEYASPPLRALASGADGGNGTYAYGSSPSFPGNTWLASNYWVDVVFVPGS
jgi:hypothetical protein